MHPYLKKIIKYQKLNDHKEVKYYGYKLLKIESSNLKLLLLIANAEQADKNPLKAIQLLQQILKIDEGYIDAFINLSVIYQEKNNFDIAASYAKKGLKYQPLNTKLLYNLGYSLQMVEQWDDAIEEYEKALKVDPKFFQALNNLGLCYNKIKHYEKAKELFQFATKVFPSSQTLNHLGMVLKNLEQYDEAEQVLKQSLQYNCEHIESLINLGNVLSQKDMFDDAFEKYQKALDLGSQDVAIYSNIGTILKKQGFIKNALEYFEKGLDIDPNHKDSKWNQTLCYLRLEDFNTGFELYESRWDVEPEIFKNKKFSHNTWNGEYLDTESLLVWAEQGLGDEIMFSTMFHELSSFSRDVIIEADTRLIKLFERTFPEITFINTDVLEKAQWKQQIAMGSLMQHMRTSSIDFPPRYQHLIVDTQLRNQYRCHLESFFPGKYYIGISWYSANKNLSKERSIDIDYLLEHLSSENIVFVNLQYGDTQDDQIKLEDKSYNIYNMPEIDLFSDIDELAALMSSLDHVITIDNTNAHLSASVGTKTWVLLPFLSDWRWGLEKIDSLWYKSIKLYRQKVRNSWDIPLLDIKKDLSVLMQEKV